MNVQLQGVYVYGGSPQHHSVFRGEEQRQHRHIVLQAILAIFLMLVFVWCLRAAFFDIAEPVQATADTPTAQTAQVAADAQAQTQTPQETSAAAQS